jgi:hypothetical protein
MGHLCGILAALIIKFCGFFVIMPRYEWIHEFDEKFGGILSNKVAYFEAKPNINEDFNGVVFRKIGNLCKPCIDKFRGRKS